MQKEVTISVGRHVNQPFVYRVTVTRDGEEVGVATGGFTKEPKIRAAIRDNFRGLVMTKDVQAAIDAFVAAGRPKGETVTYKASEVASDTTAVEKPVFERRALTATRDQAEKFDTLAEAISRPMSPGVEEIVSWSKSHRSVACCVDIDWHGGTVPSRDASNQPILDQIERAKPVPAYGWVTKHRGIRLVYTGEHADLRASIAAVEIVSRLWGAREFRPTAVELKCDTRVAPVGHRVIHFIEEQKLIVPRGADGFDDSFDHEDWVTYLEDVGMVIGQRYPHDKCLVHPEHASKSQRPVEVRDNCIICHSCQGNGIKGYIRYASSILRSDSIDTSHDSDIMTMVKNFTHYEHAEFILRLAVPPIIRDEHLKLYYRALLVRYHGDDDPRIERVFYKYGVIRTNGIWASLDGAPRKSDLMKATIASMPVAQAPDGGTIMARVERLRDGPPLNDYGYQALRPVFGIRIGTHHVPASDGVPRIVVPTSARTPTYIDEKTRKASGKSRDWAWETLDTVWPGITREYIEMLIISRGLVERGEISLAPMFFLHEAKGSGKTASIAIASGICGDYCASIIATNDASENMKKILYALDKGSFVIFDEVGKTASKQRSPKSFFDFLLQLSPRTQAKRLHAGEVSLGWLPVIAVTDTKWPEEVISDGQIGRRMFRVNLKPTTKKWYQVAGGMGLHDFADPRNVPLGSDIPLACDTLLSCIIDEYFGGTIEPLAVTAKKLGFEYMTESGARREREAALSHFYKAWYAYEPTVKCDNFGYKAFDVTDSSPLALAWDKIRDSDDRFTFSDANAESWRDLVNHPCRLEMASVKRVPNMHNCVAVSFVQGDDRDNMKPVYMGGV